jgi:hypothetical protein
MKRRFSEKLERILEDNTGRRQLMDLLTSRATSGKVQTKNGTWIVQSRREAAENYIPPAKKRA